MGMHAVSQAYVSGLSGGDVGQAFWSGMISSIVSFGAGQLNTAVGIANTTAGDISTMLFGSASGGLSSKLAGGNFWEGAAIGLTVGALNHTAHKVNFELTKDPNIPDLTKKFNTQLRITRKHFKNLRRFYDLLKGEIGIISDAIKLEHFRQLTTDGGEFDLKNLDGRKGTFGELTLEKGAYYRGEWFRSDDFGNYNFGLAAKYSGYKLWHVQFAAGINQMGKDFFWSDWRTFFDDPRDYNKIQQGYNHQFK